MMRGLTILFLLLVVFSFSILSAQPDNDLCSNAILISAPSDYCSGPTEWTSNGAGTTAGATMECFDGSFNDVFFSFVASGSAANIVINGDVGGGLRSPTVALYEASCTNIPNSAAICESKVGGASVVNLLTEDLLIGQQYIIRVGGGLDGSFQLCLNNFNPPTNPGQDADEAALLCDKTGFVIQALTGGGDDPDEAAGTCLDVGFGDSEMQSSWTAWVADNDEELTFTITPLNANDDIDFVVYELPNGVADFSGRIQIRCMASSCIGPTGLSSTSTDLIEAPGCGPGDDNFLRAIQQEDGKAYALLINNFSQTGVGISLTFGGGAEFQGPQPDFNLMVSDADFSCDKIIEFVDDSENELGSIASLEWNFGEGAVPQTAQGEGPFQVSYSTFGTKFISLTVTTSLGCKVTEVRDWEITECCNNIDEVSIEVLNKQNIGCGTAESGSFSVQGNGGLPEYMYSFNGGEYSTVSSFENLEIGDYEIGMIDRRGCELTRIISIVEVSPIIADAGEDLEVEFLGDSIMLDGSYEANVEVSVSWAPSDNLSCEGGGNMCLDPVVTPSGTTTYTLMVSDNGGGCIATDEVTVTVLKVRPLYTANVFSPNDDGINDIFFLSGSEGSVSNIRELNVFDRWGNQVYAGRNLAVNDITSGWDGLIEGNPAKDGLYVWYAVIEFVDPELPTETISGDVTLVR